jgi:hypothetical protein
MFHWNLSGASCAGQYSIMSLTHCWRHYWSDAACRGNKVEALWMQGE